MNQVIYIGCDIGTSSTKTIAVTADGVILAQAAKSYTIIQTQTNWAEQDPDLLLDAAIDTIHSVIEQLPAQAKVKSICLSALYSGTGVLCDKNYQSIRPSIIWMDRRAAEECRSIRQTVGESDILAITGNGIDSYFGYTKLMWVKKHEPENWSRIRRILPIHSYIIQKMTGEVTVDYCSAGNFGGIYDYQNHTWSEPLCADLGIPFHCLPQSFFNPSDIVGELSNEYQTKLGLQYPVKLCAGTVDCIASMLSAGIISPGDNAAVLGTSLNWGFIHGSKPDNPNLISMPYCIDPTSITYTYGGASTAGALPRWFTTQFMEADQDAAYTLLEEDIRTHNIGPGADGLIMLPYFMGERTPIWDENATGVLFGLTLSHTKAHIYRAILESVAYSLRHIMESMTTQSLKLNKIVLVGGGSRSELWKQIFADVTGFSICTPVLDVEAPLGDAFLAALGTGDITDFKSISSWITMSPSVQPDPTRHKKYNEYFSLYKELYKNLKATMQKHAAINSREGE